MVAEGGILRARARHQEPLWRGAEIGQPLAAVGGDESPIGRIAVLADGDAEPVAQVLGQLLGRGRVPAADEERRHRADPRVEARVDPPLDAAEIRLGGGEVVGGGEEQRHVHRHAREDRLLDRRQPLGRAWNLDEQVRPAGLGVQCLRGGERAGRVVGEPGRDLERHPAVDLARAIVHFEEQVGGPREVLDREVEEQPLARDPLLHLGGDRRVVERRVPEGEVVDRRVAREAGDRQLADIASERAVVEHAAGDVVEPETLAESV